MGERLKVNKAPIDPVYRQAKPNAPINLGPVSVQFAHKGKKHKANAQVTMKFLPDDRLLFVIPAKGDSRRNAQRGPMTGDQIKAALSPALGFDDKWDGKLELTEKGVVLDVFVKGRGGEHGAIAFMPKTSVVTVTPESKGISAAVFHLFNFPDFFGPESYILTEGEPPRQRERLCGRAILAADGWTITIAATDKTENLCKDLDCHGGFVVTHMGKIERDDGSAFSSDELHDLLTCVHCFLSFALGRWAGVAFPIGFDKAGNRAFEQWGLPIAAAGPWKGSPSWFDDHHGELLSEVFPGFMGLWKDSLWKPALSEGLYWYLGANGRGTGIGVDTGLILAQTALELLAWTCCVQHRKMISADAFEPRGLSAADKLRLLASALDIPLALPSHLSALHAQRGAKWRDAMDAITGIRNALVHPHAKKQLPHGSYYEAWTMSLWYIDTVLLRLCGHAGKYSNRLVKKWRGEVESVPWAKNEPETASR